MDKNQPSNRKLNREELEQSGDRITELESINLSLPREGGPFDEEAVTAAVEESGAATETRKKSAIALYAIGAADSVDDPDSKLTREEINDFLKQIEPLKPDVGKALAAFDEKATDKGGLDLSGSWVFRVMLLGQVMEILVLLVMPFALSRLGFRVTISIGIAAWAVRYGIFALGDPKGLVIASQALHGFGFGFFFVASMIYADRIAAKDIRASAQALIIFITYGAGMVVSSLLAGKVADYYDFNWHDIFLVPVAITVWCTLLFLIFFRETKAPAEPSIGQQSEGPEVG